MKTLCLSALAALLLAGCGGHAHRLVTDGNTAYLSGELVHDGGDDNRLVLTAPARRYVARGFVVEQRTDWAELRKRYGASESRHWDRIVAGLDTDHASYSVQTTVRADDGDAMSCRLVWTAMTRPAGVCTDRSGTIHPVRFE